jgi:hypothetical protein
MDDIMLQRYRPALGGILDTRGRVRVFTARPDYTAFELLETVKWLNERNRGYDVATRGCPRKYLTRQ